MPPAPPAERGDWLIHPGAAKAGVYRGEKPHELVLDNGWARRTFSLEPGVATIGLEHRGSGEQFVRSVKPEALLTLNGTDYAVGGLDGQPVHNYLRGDWVDAMKPVGVFRATGWKTGPLEARFPWKPRPEWMSREAPWPAPGVSLVFEYRTQADHPLSGVTVRVHYELYDGLPLLGKWISVHNDSTLPVTVDRFCCDVLAVVEAESTVDSKHGRPWATPNMLVVTDYAFGNMTGSDATRQSVHWEPDPDYATQVSYERQTPVLLRVGPATGPAQTMEPGGSFESFRSWILLQDSKERERAGLAERRMYRVLAPWVQENPVMMHVRQADDASVRSAVDQCSQTGFEMVILTFGSGFDFESRQDAYRQRYGELTHYAHSKGVALGGYSLLSSRSANPASDNCVTPKATHNVMPCLGANWGKAYLEQLRSFTQQAGFDVLEHDGSYPGDCCAAADHPFHKGNDDSQWVQWKAITSFYRWCRAQGVYLNIPDWYFLNGGSKCGMGYREANWSLPRAGQEIIERQNIYDGTWTKTPSMGWMFVPLTEYQGGGKAATIEPLHEHLDHYETRLANLFGAGVQACYRGPRLYDTDETKALVKRWVDFYKRYRSVLDGDLIHLRRADGRDWDGWLHVDPGQPLCGLAMIYNPLDREIVRTIRLPLYYTGLSQTARVRIGEQGRAVSLELARDYGVEIEVTVPARGRVPVFVESP